MNLIIFAGESNLPYVQGCVPSGFDLLEASRALVDSFFKLNSRNTHQDSIPCLSSNLYR
jgi:hypothetical protein